MNNIRAHDDCMQTSDHNCSWTDRLNWIELKAGLKPPSQVMHCLNNKNAMAEKIEKGSTEGFRIFILASVIKCKISL